MEDNYFVAQNILGDGTKSLFGVMDGHGGDESAKLAETLVPDEFKKLWDKTKDKMTDWHAN